MQTRVTHLVNVCMCVHIFVQYACTWKSCPLRLSPPSRPSEYLITRVSPIVTNSYRVSQIGDSPIK